jgi:hypothetical protein
MQLPENIRRILTFRTKSKKNFDVSSGLSSEGRENYMSFILKI